MLELGANPPCVTDSESTSRAEGFGQVMVGCLCPHSLAQAGEAPVERRLSQMLVASGQQVLTRWQDLVEDIN